MQMCEHKSYRIMTKINTTKKEFIPNLNFLELRNRTIQNVTGRFASYSKKNVTTTEVSVNIFPKIAHCIHFFSKFIYE